MKMFWYWMVIALAVVAFIQPELIALAGAYVELQLRKLWLLLSIWPKLQITRLQLRFMLWRAKHNLNNRNDK